MGSIDGNQPQPELRGNRIGIDTGVYVGGRLTCLVLQGYEAAFSFDVGVNPNPLRGWYDSMHACPAPDHLAGDLRFRDAADR
jgi:hypothetical protein